MLDLIAKPCRLAIGVGENMCSKQSCYLVEQYDRPTRIVAQLQKWIKSAIVGLHL